MICISRFVSDQVVIPAKAGIQVVNNFLKKVQRLDFRFRGNDGIVLAMVSIFTLHVHPFAAERLTLSTSIERALNNNPHLLIARKEVSISKTQLREAKSLFYPKINLNLDYVRYRNETLGVTSPELGSIVLEAPVQSNKTEERGNPLSENLYMGRLGFLQTLYAGGKIKTTYRLSQAGVRHAESAYEALRQEVQMRTTQHFYKLVALQKQQRVLAAMMLDLEKLGKQAPSVHGRLALSAAQADARKRLSDLHQQSASERFRYLQSMGLELFTDVDVEGELDPAASVPDLQSVLVWAKQNRMELKETLLQEEVDQLSVELSRAERYPVFLLGGSFEARNSEFPLNENNWNTVLSMNIPIFDGFSGYARVKESRYRADQGRLKRVQLEDQVEMEVRSAYDDWLHWSEEAKARLNQLDMLEGSRQEAFGNNQSANPLSQRLDYLRWWSDASLSLIDAKYELCSAQARLTKAVGKDIGQK